MTHVCILVGSDCNELGLGEDEGEWLTTAEGIFCSILLHLRDMQAWLVLVERLQHYHLCGEREI